MKKAKHTPGHYNLSVTQFQSSFSLFTLIYLFPPIIHIYLFSFLFILSYLIHAYYYFLLTIFTFVFIFFMLHNIYLLKVQQGFLVN